MSLIGEAFVRIRPDDTGFRAEATKQVKRDLAGVERSASSSNRELGRFNRGALVGTGALAGLGRAAAFASASFIGGAGLVYGLRSTIAAAEDAQAVQAQLANALEQQNISLKDNREAIDRRTQALSQMSGIDDELITTTFINFVRRTGDVTKALHLNAIAVDVARGRNISLEASSALVTRASLGMAGSLRRVGIAAHEGASATELLDLLQRKYAGSAEAYGKTAVGAQERFKVALENTQETIGKSLLPSITLLLDKTTKWLNDPKNQEKIQQGVQKAADTTERSVGILTRTYRGASDVAHTFAGALNRIDHALGGGKPNRDDAQKALEKEIQSYKTLIALQESSLALQKERNPAQGLPSFPVSPINIPSRVKGHGFVGRPLTAAEQLAITLAGNPEDVQALQAQRAQYEKSLAFAKAQVAAEVGNTAQWAKDIANLAGQIQGINDNLNQIAIDKAAKANAARLAAIDKLIPNSISGRGFAGSAFARFQALIAGTIPGRISGGGGPVDVSALLDQSKAQQEAQLRTQIAEATVTNEKKLIPFYQAELAADQEHLKLLRKIGATTVQKLQEQLNIAQTKKRIRDILHSDKAAEDAFSIQALFGEGGRQFAAYGSNVAPLNQPLSRQEGGGAAVRAAQAGGKTIQIVQNFIGARDAGQAIQEASNAARALRY